MRQSGYTAVWPDGHRLELGRLGGEGDRSDSREAFGRNRVIAPVTVTAASLALFLDVRDFAAGGHFAIAADDASAGERREAEKPNETVHAVLPCDRSAIYMPLRFSRRALSTAMHIGCEARINRG